MLSFSLVCFISAFGVIVVLVLFVCGGLVLRDYQLVCGFGWIVLWFVCGVSIAHGLC